MDLLFLRMYVRRFAVAVRVLAMILGGVGVFARFFVIAVIVMVGRLPMMMSGSVVGSGGVVMMLARRVLFLASHGHSFHKTDSATAVINPCAVIGPRARL
jgi:hypothetical protein